MNKNIKLIINYLLGPILFVWLMINLYHQIVEQPDLAIRWKEVKSSWQQGAFWLVIGLMPINWGLEAKKWQLLINQIDPIRFPQALRAIFAGCSITLLTPNRIGEYGGRVLFVAPRHRLQAVSLTILGSMSQLFVTLLMGALGIFLLSYFGFTFESVPDSLKLFINNWVLFAIVLAALFLMLCYIKAPVLIKKLSHIKSLNWFTKHLYAVQILKRKILLSVLSLSFLRYLLFILQYILLLNVMDVQIPIGTAFLLISLFYLLITIAPTIGMTELPLRASVSVLILGTFSNNCLGIQATAFAIWLINLVLPALIGSLLLIRLKLMKEP